MKKLLLLFIFILISFISNSQELDELWIREELTVRDTLIKDLITATTGETDSIKFNVTTRSAHTEGMLNYDDDTRSLVFQNDINNFNHNLGYELVARVYNSSGAAILDGSVVRLVGNFKDGTKITPRVKLAGNSSIDSILVLGMATVDILNNSYGIVTLRGEIKGLNTTFCSNDSCSIYLGFGGGKIDSIPPPPSFSVRLGQVFYADADSGRIFFNPTTPEYLPSPHISGDTSRYNTSLDLTQNVFTNIPLSAFTLEDEFGYTLIGDSILALQNGHITIAFNMSFIGNAQSDVWRVGIFINGIEINSVSRSTASTAVGNLTVIKTTDFDAGDYMTFKMTNESADRDPTLADISYELIFLHLD